ncbi:zinc finger protein 862-like [Palaemon carinicauda]|uniref:zinc finger protein 862-like n=1 Tax=Palaemon carinicauda TaxID=392227 RepID=UPI0035B5A389
MLTEGRIASFIAENNLPFSLSKSLVDLIKATCPNNSAENNMLHELKMSATKCTNIIRQGLGFRFSKELIDRLKVTKFSIIPDETTDVSGDKQLAICVVYFDYEKFESVTSFFDMVNVHKCDSVSLYEAIKKCFEDKSIPLINIIGFSSDTCNVMFGETLSVVALMKSEFPNITFVKCNCHMIHLCMSHACLKLSTSLEDLCRNVFNHFSRSSLRQHDLEEFQKFLDISPHKMLAPGQTRWLSLEACVARLLEQWDALVLYFTALVDEKRDPSYTTKSILKSLKNAFIKAQLQFLQVQLRRANEFNTMFQSNKPVLLYLHDQVKKLLKDIMSDFIQISCVRECDPFTLDVYNTRYHVPISQIYLGINATDTLSDSAVSKDREGMTKFKKGCQEFLLELINQIRRRFKTESFKILDFLIPENALNLKPSSLRNVFKSFPVLNDLFDKEEVDLEWRHLALHGGMMNGEDAAEFWKQQLSVKKINGQMKYPNLSKVVGYCLALPNSNAAVERLFSHVRLIKTDVRNSLKSSSLNSLLHVKNGLKIAGISAHELILDDRLKYAMSGVKSDATDDECKNILKEKFRK